MSYYERESPQQRETNAQRRDRVLAYPDLAEYLTRPPLSMPDPHLWSGYIPPAQWREQANNSPVRAQLIAICNMVAERERVTANRGLSEGPDSDEGRPPVAPELITEAQMTKLHTTLTEYGITERDDKLMFFEAELNHDVASSKDLTKAEASALIDKLDMLIRLEHEHDLKGIADATQNQSGPDGEGGAEPGAEPDPWGTPNPSPDWKVTDEPGGGDEPPY